MISTPAFPLRSDRTIDTANGARAAAVVAANETSASFSKPIRWPAAARPERASRFQAHRSCKCRPVLKTLSLLTAMIVWWLLSLTLPPEILRRAASG